MSYTLLPTDLVPTGISGDWLPHSCMHGRDKCVFRVKIWEPWLEKEAKTAPELVAILYGVISIFRI